MIGDRLACWRAQPLANGSEVGLGSPLTWRLDEAAPEIGRHEQLVEE